jgi:hypothetical protein
MRHTAYILVLLIGLTTSLLFVGPVSGRAQSVVDHDLYAQLLTQHVRDGVVDYGGLKRQEALLDRYLDQLAGVDPDGLADKERFAFYTNAYNAWTLKLILDHYPGIQSIKDTGRLWQSPWKKKIARIDGGLLSLDEIEHDILRARYRDPRVHFAVNCASKGCPPLYGEPFTGRDLDRQLDHVTRAFINDPARYRLEGDTLHVSRIFKWFAEDFNDDPVGFFKTYAEEPLRSQLDAVPGNVRVTYLDYDWSLNGT